MKTLRLLRDFAHLLRQQSSGDLFLASVHLLLVFGGAALLGFLLFPLLAALL